MKTSIITALLALSGCMTATIDVPADASSYDGTVSCMERCDGCCSGDPSSPDAVCVPYDAQDDSACGKLGRLCYACDHFNDPWGGPGFDMTCSKTIDGGPFGTGGCIKKEQ